MHKTLALLSALSQEQAIDHPHSAPLAPVDQMLAAALLELDLDAAQGQNRRVGRLTNISAHRKEFAATKRAHRSTLNEIAASLGVSRSTLNRILDEPPVRHEERHVEQPWRSWDGKRHENGTGRRRRTGAGGRTRTGVGVLRRGRVRN